jgi:hypothetical protein
VGLTGPSAESKLLGVIIAAKGPNGEWGLVNRVVPDPEISAATRELLARGTSQSKAIGKRAFHRPRFD